MEWSLYPWNPWKINRQRLLERVISIFLTILDLCCTSASTSYVLSCPCLQFYFQWHLQSSMSRSVKTIKTTLQQIETQLPSNLTQLTTPVWGHLTTQISILLSTALTMTKLRSNYQEHGPSKIMMPMINLLQGCPNNLQTTRVWWTATIEYKL